jgi:multidrug efflux system outer membrane protein
MNKKLWLALPVSVLLACVPAHQALTTFEALPAYPVGNDAPRIPSHGALKWQDWVVDAQLKSLIQEAFDKNLEIKYLDQAIHMSDAEILARKGEYLPFVNLLAASDGGRVGSFTRWGALEHQIEIIPGEENPEFLKNHQVGAVASWEVDLWQKLRNEKRAAVQEWLATQEAKHMAQSALLSEVTHLYYEICALDLQKQTLQTTIEIQLDALEIVKLLKANGREDQLAVLRYAAEVQKNQGILFHLDQQKSQALNMLSVLLAKPAGALSIETEALVDFSVPSVSSGVSSDLLTNRPDIRKAERELQAANFDLKAARAAFYPQITLRAGGGLEAFKLQYLALSPEAVAYNLAGDLVGPLVNRRGLKARFKKANSHQIQVALDYQQSTLTAYAEVVTLLTKQENMAQAMARQSEQVALLEEGVSVSKQLFQSARADYVEVLMTQREALEAKMEWIETKKEQWLTWMDLYVALGGGWN